jgi:hypothetical protein
LCTTTSSMARICAAGGSPCIPGGATTSPSPPAVRCYAPHD